MLKPQGPFLPSGRCGPWWEMWTTEVSTRGASCPGQGESCPAPAREELSPGSWARCDFSPQADIGSRWAEEMKSHQAVKEQPQQGGHGVLWLDPEDGAWSGGSRNHQLQQAVWVGASLPMLLGERGMLCSPYARLNSGFSGLGPGVMFYPEHVSPYRQTKSYCSEGSHYHMNLHL